MRRPSEPGDRTPPATPETPHTDNRARVSGTERPRTLSAAHASQRSPSPFEASTSLHSRNNSVDAGSTTQGDLYDATPAREVGLPRLTVSSADASDEYQGPSDIEDDIAERVNNMGLGSSEDIDHQSAEEESLSAAFNNLDFNQQISSSGLSNARYSMRAEPLPAEPYYEHGFQNALKRGTQLAAQVAFCLEKCPAVHDPDSSLHKLSCEASELSRYKSPATRTIGVIGKSGSGKSSLINSLLQVDELALTGSAGTAVTAFATEYRYQPIHDAPKFTVTAYCLNAEEIDENLGELLQDFSKPYLIARTELTAEEYQAVEERSEAARTIFETAFGQYDDFSLDKLAHEEGGYEHAFECLKQWARQLKWPTGTRNGMWEASANTEDQCQQQTEPFVDLGLWPFVKKVVIYLHSPVLRNGLILADLPGYHDVNFARVAAARKFQSTCDEIFVVTDIKRGVDDPIIKEVIRESSTTANVGKVTRPNITVVCSHAGDLGSAQDKRKLLKLVPQTTIKHAQKQIDKVNQQSGRFSDARRAIQQADMNMKGLLIHARNNQVKRNLQELYAEHFSPKRLPVFCIDNSYYQEQEPHAVELSGIPDLRRYCLSLPGRALFRSADTFLASRLPALVNSLDIWLDAAHTAGRESFSNVLDGKLLHDKLDSMLEDWKANFGQKCKHNLKTPCSYQKKGSILADACTTCESWNGMHHSSYRAWVRHNGTHSTKTIKYKCWNTELVASLNHVLTPYWVSFDSEAENDIFAISTKLQDYLNRFEQAAKVAKAPQSLKKNLTARRRLIETVFDDGIEDFMRGFRLVKHNGTSGNLTSYMLSYMRPVYQVAARDRGLGVTERNSNMIYTHVNDSSFVTAHSKRICDDLKELAERLVDSLSQKVHSILDATDRDLETIEAPDVALLEKYPVFGRSVEEMLRTARTELESIEVDAREAREDASRREYI